MSDETQIAQKLAENVPRSAPVIDSPPTEVLTGPSALQSNVALDTDTVAQEVAMALDLPLSATLIPENNSRLKTIIEWASRMGDTADKDQIKNIISRYQDILGLTYREDKFMKLYAFAKTQLFISEMGAS